MPRRARTSKPAAPSIVSRRCELRGFDGAVAARVNIVTAGDDIPLIVLLDGEPYLRDAAGDALHFNRVRPFRALSAS